MTEISPSFLDSFEPYLRITIFSIIMTSIAFFEVFCPRRSLKASKARRWMYNFSLLFLNIAVIRVLFPFAAVGIAQFADEQQLGILNNIPLQSGIAFIAGFVILDFSIYWQHRLFHIIPLFWRLHKVHHSDIDFDTTTGFRFHPIEIILSMLIKAVIIIALGIPIQAVILFEIVLSSNALFNHSNIRIPKQIDQYLRWFIVTPDMHRVHHSVDWHESNRNFGFNFPWWDKLFKSYQQQPNEGHADMKIGLSEYPNNINIRLYQLLIMPFNIQLKSSKNDVNTQ